MGNGLSARGRTWKGKTRCRMFFAPIWGSSVYWEEREHYQAPYDISSAYIPEDGDKQWCGKWDSRDCFVSNIPLLPAGDMLWIGTTRELEYDYQVLFIYCTHSKKILTLWTHICDWYITFYHVISWSYYYML